MPKMFNSLVSSHVTGTNDSCSLTCYKIHKETCGLKKEEEKSKTVEQNTAKGTGNAATVGEDFQREYNILSVGQLAILRIAHVEQGTDKLGKNKELVALLNSSVFRTFFRNLLRDVPEGIDLEEEELPTNEVASLEKALSLIQQVRTEESGQVVNELENLIDQIHTIAGEYHR